MNDANEVYWPDADWMWKREKNDFFTHLKRPNMQSSNLLSHLQEVYVTIHRRPKCVPKTEEMKLSTFQTKKGSPR